MVRKLIALGRRIVGALGRVPSALLVISALVTAVMYCGNDNFDRKPEAPRGDGVYRPVIARGDGHMHFLITRSVVFDRDFNFDNDLAQFGDPWRQPVTVTGRKNVMQQIGPSLVWAPILALAHGGAVLANALGADIQPHGYTLFHQRVLFASSVVFAWLAIALGLLVAYRLIGGRWASVWAAIAVLLGTSLTYYATFMPSYAHAMDAAACAGFLGLWAVSLGDLRWRRFLWLGVLLGIAAMVRIQDLAMGIVVALELAILAAQRIRERDARAVVGLLARGAASLAIAIALHTPQFYVWNEMYGSWLTTPQGPGQMRYGHPMVLELLFSARNGWLSTHPIAYLAVIGLVAGTITGPRLGKHVRLVCVAMLLVVSGQVYINAVTYEWWSGASFGQRRMCSVTLSLVVGLAVLLRVVHVMLVPRLASWWSRLRGRPVPTGSTRRAIAEQAVTLVVLGFLVGWNLVWVSRLSLGRPAGRDNIPTCCRDVPAPLSWVARPIYAVIGNPFELPASLWFAIEHGVEVQRWDATVGSYPLVPGVLGYQDGSYRRATATWNLTDASGGRFLLDGFGPPQRAPTAGKPWRWTTAERAEALLPILMPEPHRVEIPLAGNVAPGETIEVRVLCNGGEVTRAQVGPEWTTVVFTTDGSLGENEIAIEATPRPFRRVSARGPGAPPSPVSVGVAMGPWRIGLPNDHATVAR